MGFLGIVLEMIFDDRPRDGPRIVCDERGVTIHFVGSDAERFDWDAIDTIVGYKRDLVTTDEAFLVFDLGGTPPRKVEVSEEWPGYDRLLDHLRIRFGVGGDRYAELVRPAFDITPRTLFTRAPVTGER